MRVDRRLFRSTLAHRVFLVFALCALLPIAVFAVVSNRSVTEQLMVQAGERLRQAAKSQGLSLYERLLFAEVELDAVAADLAGSGGSTEGPPAPGRLRRVVVVDEAAGAGDGGQGAADSFRLRQREDHLMRGGSLLQVTPGDGSSSSVRLIRRLQPDDPSSPVVVGEVDFAYLWGLETGNVIPADAEYCVFERGGEVVYGGFDGCAGAWRALAAGAAAADGGAAPPVLRVDGADGRRFVAGWRDLFLGARFGAGDWLVVVTEPRSVVLAPVARWRVLFPAVVLLALSVVLLLVIVAIRHTLDPIDEFRDASEALARGELGRRVELHGGDEFEDLARAFNAMSDQLRRQFAALDATARTHRAILSSLDASQVVEATLDGLLDYFRADRAVVVVAEPRGGRFLRHAAEAPGPHRAEIDEIPPPEPERSAELISAQPGVVLGHDAPVSPWLSTWMGLGDPATVAVLPIRLGEDLAAVLALGWKVTRTLPEADLEQLVQIGDQFAVALANARMVAEVHDFSAGTLEALARAVDAKSPWTAGHSQRVTHLAVAIGRALGFDGTELSRLYRGAMLHDMGKLGIPQQMLDKRGRLDDNEFSVVMSHTAIGERILEPIGAFAEIMPVVTQHHERYDGSGYPAGLAGENIDLKARILAVADVYDAMTNPRPYRESVEPREVVSMISAQSGTQFDPVVVGAFLEVIEVHGGIDSVDWIRNQASDQPAGAVGGTRVGGPPPGKVS